MILLALLLACSSQAPPPPPATTPPARVDPDQQALAALDIPGPGEARRYRVTHLLHFPAPEAADSAAVAVSSLDLRVEPEAGEAGETWEVAAWEDTALSLEHVHAHRAALEQLAASYGGVYEGWEAEALPVGPMPAEEPGEEEVAEE